MILINEVPQQKRSEDAAPRPRAAASIAGSDPRLLSHQDPTPTAPRRVGEAKAPLANRRNCLAEAGKMEAANGIRNADFGMLLYADSTVRAAVATETNATLCTEVNLLHHLRRDHRRREQPTVLTHHLQDLLLDFH